MSNKPKVNLSEFIAPSLPGRVYEFWFQHVSDERNLTLPTPEVFKPWFTKDAAFDFECAAQFKPILAAIHQAHPEPQTQAQAKSQAKEILDLIKPNSGVDWLGLIILLDQLPRNCYRGAESAIVFRYFDPIARVIAIRAVEKDIPSSSPEIRYRLTLRHWFYLPFMHSENVGDQELALEKYREMDEDVRRLLDEPPAKGLSEKEAACREILASNREAVEGISALNSRFQKEHQDIVVQFGRFPYRNKALNRISTPEEEKFLRENNISFA
ncbi:DUF924 family protein [Aspergillus lucknowensis]|uniref:DUF924-domain-containing protein n=1 Tax=Aspergillus lucknowensis TaxID=176173 RepID=A0ABR4L8L0_9EURO